MKLTIEYLKKMILDEIYAPTKRGMRAQRAGQRMKAGIDPHMISSLADIDITGDIDDQTSAYELADILGSEEKAPIGDLKGSQLGMKWKLLEQAPSLLGKILDFVGNIAGTEYFLSGDWWKSNMDQKPVMSGPNSVVRNGIEWDNAVIDVNGLAEFAVRYTEEDIKVKHFRLPKNVVDAKMSAWNDIKYDMFNVYKKHIRKMANKGLIIVDDNDQVYVKF